MALESGMYLAPRVQPRIEQYATRTEKYGIHPTLPYVGRLSCCGKLFCLIKGRKLTVKCQQRICSSAGVRRGREVQDLGPGAVG